MKCFQYESSKQPTNGSMHTQIQKISSGGVLPDNLFFKVIHVCHRALYEPASDLDSNYLTLWWYQLAFESLSRSEQDFDQSWS